MQELNKPTWADFIRSVTNCSTCKNYPKTKMGSKPWNGADLKEPQRSRNGLLFISEAPPGGDSGSYFLNSIKNDGLRARLFHALSLANNAPKFQSINEFLGEGCYLLPSFSYPCSKETGGNTNPTLGMAIHSAETHLTIAIGCLKPKIVVLLGSRALAAGIAMNLVERRGTPYSVRRYRHLTPYSSQNAEYGKISTFVTYWPIERIGKDEYDNWLVPTLDAAFSKFKT